MVRFNKNNKKTLGFTLVELLAVIVILSVILIIGVPTLVSNIKEKKQIASNKVYDLIKSAARNYEIDYNIRERQSLAVKDLCERYIACPIIDPVTNEEIDGYISIGDGEYNFIGLIKLDVDLAGGSPSQSFEEEYPAYTIIKLLEPTKANNDFVRWEIVKGNSTIDDDKLKLGNTDTEIYAIWQNWPTLTVDLDGGTNGQSFANSYKAGTTIELISPTKPDYIFAGWEVTSGNGTISGNNFTMGSEDTTLTAKWIDGNFITYYWCEDGNVGNSNNYVFTFTGNCTVIDDGNNNWRVKFLTSGTFTPNISTNIDVFLVGGGGGGGILRDLNVGAGGGGGGYTTTASTNLVAGNSYTITIGAGGSAEKSGGTTSAFGITAAGGQAGLSSRVGGAGGSGGGGGGTADGSGGARGGSDGSNGGTTSYGNTAKSGTGQGRTTREFGESSGTLYSGGGGGGAGGNSEGVSWAGGGAGGAGGGASGGANSAGSSAAENTGGGGGGGSYGKNGGNGGSGIVVIRNAR